MAKYPNIITLRLSNKQLEELKQYADEKDENITDVVRSLIVECLSDKLALV